MSEAEAIPAKPGHGKKKWTLGRVTLYGVHWAIMINMAVEIFYASYMVFTVLKPAGVEGPLWGAAIKLIAEQPDLMMTRRMYATESWIAIVGLSIYVALTEIMPRMKRYREEDRVRAQQQ